MTEQKIETKQSNGLSKNMKAVLCYAGGWVTGLVFILVEKKDGFVRFHAMQSLVVFGVLQVLFFTGILAPLAMIGGFVLWLVLIVKAYQGEEFELPYIGAFAKKQLGKMK